MKTDIMSSTFYELSEDEKKLLAEICIKKEKLLLEIKQYEEELAEVQTEMEQIDVPENDSKNNPKLRLMSTGKKKFNMDPKKGMEYLIENNLVDNTAESIANFLFTGEGLNKTAIGEYLGERIDLNIEVLHKFVQLNEFKNKLLVEALRDFLWTFRLPGEAQKIDRMMDAFSQRYCDCNPNVFQNSESCYVLSFAIIMLNTNLHNVNVKEKQTVDQFIKMCRDTAKSEELNEQMLKDFYNNIKKEPFKIPVDDGNDFMLTFFNPVREGWLWKQGGKYKNWKRRWFILTDGCLYYFEYTADKEPRGIIPLENVNVREVDDQKKQYCFEIYSTTNDRIKACKHDSDGKAIAGKHTVYRMSCSTCEDKNEWIKCIRDCISENPVYNTTSTKRKGSSK